MNSAASQGTGEREVHHRGALFPLEEPLGRPEMIGVDLLRWFSRRLPIFDI